LVEEAHEKEGTICNNFSPPMLLLCREYNTISRPALPGGPMQPFRVVKTRDYQKAYQQLSPRLQNLVDSKVQLLLQNPTHPSLQTHRLRVVKAKNIWNCYISMNKRLIYQYTNKMIYLWDVGEHAIVERVQTRRFL
jgi:mRNA interferase RelE/StbE